VVIPPIFGRNLGTNLLPSGLLLSDLSSLHFCCLARAICSSAIDIPPVPICSSLYFGGWQPQLRTSVLLSIFERRKLAVAALHWPHTSGPELRGANGILGDILQIAERPSSADAEPRKARRSGRLERFVGRLARQGRWFPGAPTAIHRTPALVHQCRSSSFEALPAWLFAIFQNRGH